MKFKFDLLPQKYKCLPQDNFLIGLGVVAMVFSIVATFMLYQKNNSVLKGHLAEIASLETQIDGIYKGMNQYQSPNSRILSLKNTIDFINKNLETPGTSLVDFLFTFESLVPERVFVKDINPKEFSSIVKSFSLEGEAASIYDILDFISRLQKSGRFEKVFLKRDSISSGGKDAIVTFSLTFDFKGKGK